MIREPVTDDVRADDGCRLWVSASGAGVPVILCHGGPGLWDMFGDLADSLAARTVRWDQRGCGRSERRGPYSVERSVRDLDAVRAHFGFDRVAVLGHSWGATLALRYALAHPERVRGLVYVAGTGLGHDWRAEFKRNAEARLTGQVGRDRTDDDRERAVAQWSADFTDPATARSYAERMADPWFPINYECNATISAEARQDEETALVAACRALPVPTLVIDGADDLRPRWAVDSLARALPVVTRVVLPGVGHVPWFEAPDEFAAAVSDFLG
ncbi:alpha/beta hydrolase [Actinokineospora auranticolor]|uniref:Proline iminopeptidase n=1 Tax=Actinokineospora auranticolor TaxID=155976 RepID=A0A2S6GBS7_9PSEU|nr:alpha/beta hydrolase [Actinokineospora auranticolor]PPK60987.1 proline iminopeptidase [Actinokineospora auranticolor]